MRRWVKLTIQPCQKPKESGLLLRIMRRINERWPLEGAMPGRTVYRHVFEISVRLVFPLPITTDLFQLICLAPPLTKASDTSRSRGRNGVNKSVVLAALAIIWRLPLPGVNDEAL